MTTRVAVVGAGIVGLSCAVAIQQQVPSASVTLISELFERDTTSIGAGGIFVPVPKGADAKTFHLWASEGAKYFFDLAFSENSAKSGVNLITGYEVMNNKKEPRPWFPYMPFVADMTPELLQRFAPYYEHGYIFTTVIVEGPKYLPWLMKRFKENGGKVVQQKVNAFRELSGSFDIVVNCTGLGSRDLADDFDLHSSRGHVIRVSAPWIKHFVHADDDSYVLPSSETVAVGGVKQAHRTDMAPLAAEHHEIWHNMKERFPALEGSKILWDWIGLRPMRSKLRLEKETLNCGGKQLQIIHNYGHGAHGISLSWGTAIHVAQLVSGMLQTQAKL